MKSISVLFLLVLLPESISVPPLAFHQIVVASPGEEVVITLRGYDKDGDKLTASILSPPSKGSLYQVSQVYDTYGYEPKLGSSLQVGATITGSKNRIVYKLPASASNLADDKWDTFSYVINDGYSTSKYGTVTVVPTTGVITQSNFFTSAEGWSIDGNGAGSSAVVFDGSRQGAYLNRYIYGSDMVINTDVSSDIDRQLWYFVAPSKFHGNQGASYGGTLTFSLTSFAGDFTKSHQSSAVPLVVLECAACDSYRGIRLAISTLPANQGGAGTLPSSGSGQFNIALTEKGGWKKDPKNSLVEWVKPTKCEMIQVLSNLSKIKVLGDFTPWYETVGIDNVAFQQKMAKIQLPTCAQGSPDATKCTCA